MMDGLLLVCLTGICASPDPLLLYEHLPAPASLDSPAAVTQARTPVRSPSVPATIQAPAPIETDAAEEPTSGAITSRAAIAELVSGRTDGVRRCYEKGLVDDPHFKGTIEMGWKIDVGGQVTSTNVVTASPRNPVVEECLRAEIMRWTFPASAEPVVIGSYPFALDAALLRHHGARGRAAASRPR